MRLLCCGSVTSPSVSSRTHAVDHFTARTAHRIKVMLCCCGNRSVQLNRDSLDYWSSLTQQQHRPPLHLTGVSCAALPYQVERFVTERGFCEVKLFSAQRLGAFFFFLLVQTFILRRSALLNIRTGKTANRPPHEPGERFFYDDLKLQFIKASTLFIRKRFLYTKKHPNLVSRGSQRTK